MFEIVFVAQVKENEENEDIREAFRVFDRDGDGYLYISYSFISYLIISYRGWGRVSFHILSYHGYIGYGYYLDLINQYWCN